MAPLAGKVALVTGSSRGIGRAIAERLARDGAAVVVNYCHQAEKAAEVVVTIHASDGQAVAVQADPSDVAQIRRLFEETVEHFGRLDVVVTNAGTARRAR
jgi:3-oxoacyl-[acyl-carrier protein] reductase